MSLRQIHELLYKLGIGRNYLGHNIIVLAIQIILRDKDCLLCVKDGIYLPIAEQHQCEWRTVERNIRTAIRRAWKLNRPFLEQMAFYPLEDEPTVTEFLDILSVFVSRISG